jgi:5-methylcytosine-specific restriction endonuclease McrA
MNCEVCGIHHFSCKQAYERHIKSKRHKNVVNNVENPTPTLYQCTDCSRYYASRSCLSHHKKKCLNRSTPVDEAVVGRLKEDLLSVKEETRILKEAQTKHATEIAELKALLKHQSTVIKSLERQLKTFEASGLLPPSDTQPRKAAVRKKPNAKERKEIATSQENKCVDCKKELSEYYEIDHIIGLQYGGDNHPDNLQALCCECHSKKSILENKHRKEIQSAIRTILTES